MEELEALKQELLESQDKTQANLQLRAEREKQYLSVKVYVREIWKSWKNSLFRSFFLLSPPTLNHIISRKN